MKPFAVSAGLAWRYLRAPKSHSAVSAVGAVSVAGVAVATAAIICVLSVFNGFRSLMAVNLDTLAPDVVVAPAAGKAIDRADSLAAVLSRVPGVELAVPALVDNALAVADNREMPVTLRGVDPALYPRLTSIDSLTLGGTRLDTLGPREALVAVGVASKLGIRFTGTPILLFAPRREGRINVANPMGAFVTDSLAAADVFQTQEGEYDGNTVICDIDVARSLFQRPGGASLIEIKALPGTDADALRQAVAEKAGGAFTVRDRLQLQETNFRMVAVEKWVTFLLLAFILAIASFNVISTMCMLVIEKQHTFGTLAALGMDRRRIGATFAWEAWAVTAAGGLAGIALGVALCLLQEKFGFIKLAGDPEALTVTSYPVRLEWTDAAATLVPLAAIGLATAWTASLFARRRAV